MNAASANNAPQAQLDPRQIAMLRSLRQGTLLPQLLRTYRDQVTQQIHELRTAIDMQDHATTRIVAHTLKSASFSVGARHIGELCTQLERHATNQQSSGNTQLIVELETCLANLLPEIAEYLPS